MSALENAQQRLQYRGGNAEARNNQDKLNSLKKALLYAYQSETLQLNDGREFRCLINRDKLKPEYDNKILSIPFKDVCLNADKVGKTTDGIEEVGLKPGDTFLWKDTNTYWIIYLQYLEESAYFRAEIRRCEVEVEIGENSYWVYAQGPTETKLQWNQKGGINWNEMNYSMIIYVTKNDETLDYFHRFSKIKIDGQTWEVAVVNTIDADGIIEVRLNESFNNTILDERTEELESETTEEVTNEYIQGESTLKPYDIANYTIVGKEGGTWVIDGTKASFITQSSSEARVQVISGRSGSFNLIYRIDGEDDIVLPITIESL